MSEPLPSIDQPMPDLGHEGIRVAVVKAIDDVTARIDLLQQEFAAAQQQLSDTATGAQQLAATVAELQAAVAALQPAPPTP